MELLIPGLLLVALMVWASTRIKKIASAAFDAETVESDEFSIAKPEGFLHVLNDDSGLAFRSYSKDFGKVGNKDVRQATIEIQQHSGEELNGVRKKIEDAAESITSLETYIDGGERAALMNSVEILNGGEYVVRRKLVTRCSDVWECRCSVLSAHEEELSDKLETVLDSVRIK